MVSQLPSGGFYLGGKGGFLNAIVGSLYIVGGSTLLGLLISLPVVFYMNVYLKPNSKFGYVARLGATRIETIGVVLRQIAPAIATATLLSIGKAIGDCAGVMFTAGFSDHIPHGLNQQAATLPLSVFFQLSAPQEDVQNRAYAAAVVLTIIVLILSFGGRYIMAHFSKNKV